MVGVLAAIGFVGVRLLLPDVSQKKAEIEAFLQRTSGYTVRIDAIDAHWDGLHPGLQLKGISIYAAGADRPAVRLAELRVSLKILPLLIGRLDLHSAVLVRPTLTLERLVDGRFHISGIDVTAADDATQNEAFVESLFRQGDIAIEDGELQWRDRRESERPLKLTHVHLQLHNSGDQHRLGMTADFPDNLCNACSLVADVSGNPFGTETFSGELYLRGVDVMPERMPRVIREQLPPTLRGAFSVEVWTRWQDSRPTSADGDVAVTELRLPLAGLRTPLALKQATTRLHWQRRHDGFVATLEEVRLALHGTPWSAGKIEFTQRGNDTTVRIGRIELGDVSAFVASLHLQQAKEETPYVEAAARWNALKPTGVVKNLQIDVTGALDEPEDYRLSADVDQLALEPYQSWPGVRGVDANLTIARAAGEVRLELHHGALALPQLFRAPLPIQRAAVRVRWQRQAEQWVVNADDLSIANCATAISVISRSTTARAGSRSAPTSKMPCTNFFRAGRRLAPRPQMCSCKAGTSP